MSNLQQDLHQRSVGGGSTSPRRSSLQVAAEDNVVPNGAEVNKAAMEEELGGHWIGPVPESEFLNNFLPLAKGEPKAPDVNPFANLPEKVSAEKHLYALLMGCVEEPVQVRTRSKVRLMPNHKMVDTSAHTDKQSARGKQYKPDLSTYGRDVDTGTEKHCTEKQQLPWEIKPDPSWEICKDPPLESEQPDEGTAGQDGNGREDEAILHLPDGRNSEGNSENLDTENGSVVESTAARTPFEKSTDNAQTARGQLAAYTAAMNSCQHRLHSFTVYVFYPYVRLIRFDRAGIIVSRAFNIRENGQILADFLWRFDRASPATRGIDDTVRQATGEEVELAKKFLKDYEPAQPRPVVVFSIPPNHDGDPKREFIGWGPMSEAESLTGRATRPYAVIDKETEKLCFLKDSWRAESLQPEAEILKTLNEKGVPHVPKWMCGGDIKGHSTRTQDFVPSDDSATPSLAGSRLRIIRRIHHRFVEDCIGVTLSKFKSTRDLLRAIYHAALAHRAAYVECHILHRDISSNNILLVWDDEKKQWNGMLIDWDLAKDIREMNPRDHHLTGTWQFISTRLCMDCNKGHTLQDDLESMVLVVVHHAIRYTRHNKIENSRLLIEQVFSTCVIDPSGQPSGGAQKYSMFCSGGGLLNQGYDFEIKGNTPLNTWILDTLEAVAEWIRLWQHEETAQRKTMRLITLDSPKPLPVPREKAFLRDHNQFIEFCEKVLDLQGWPQDDAAIDNCLPGPASSSAKKDSQSPTTSSGGKRSLEPPVDGPRKRSRSAPNN